MAIETSVKINAVVEGLNQVQSQFDRLGRNLTRIGRGLTLGLTAPIAAFGVAGVRAFNEQAQAIAQVEQGLRSTGNQVGRTSQQLQQLASGLQENSLFGDEEILQGVTAQLLTFTSIAETQFERTQQAALDLATRLGGDLQSSAIQLGRALNDPTRNLSALARSGIQFSDSQIEVIKQLQSTNRLADAQNVILEELERQYGGSAAAAAAAGTGPLTQLRNSLGDLSEQFGAVISEAILPFIRVLQSLVREFRTLSPETRRIITVIVGLAAALGPALIIIGRMSIGLSALVSAFRAVGIAARLSSLTIRSAFIASGIGVLVVAVGAAIARIIEMRTNLGSFSNVFTVIGLQINRFALLIRQRFSQASQSVSNFFRGLVGAEQATGAGSQFNDQIRAIEEQIQFVSDTARAEARDPANTISFDGQINTEGLIQSVDIASTAASASAKPIEVPAMITLDQELSTSNSVLEGAQAFNRGALLEAQLNGAGEQQLNAIRIQGLQDYRNTLDLVLQDQLELQRVQNDPRVTDSINNIRQGLVDTDAELAKLIETSNAVPVSFNGAELAFQSFSQQAANGLQNVTGSALNGVTNALAGIVTGTKDAATAFRDLANSVIQDLVRIGIQRAIVASIDSLFPGSSNPASRAGSIPGFASGSDGAIFKGPGGPRSDSILARVSAGEAITRASSVAEIGSDFFRMINRYGKKGLEDYISGKRQKISGSRKLFKSGVQAFQDGGIVENAIENRQQAMPNLTINIENNSQARIQAIQPEGPTIRDQVRGIVYSVILEDAEVGGPLTRASRG